MYTHQNKLLNEGQINFFKTPNCRVAESASNVYSCDVHSTSSFNHSTF